MFSAPAPLGHGLSALSGAQLAVPAQRPHVHVHAQPAGPARRAGGARRSAAASPDASPSTRDAPGRSAPVFAVQSPEAPAPVARVPPVKRLTVRREDVPNPFLNGNFYPQDAEMVVTDLPITGELPADIDGTYLRNGPNPQFVPEDYRYHWFDGDGMLHGVTMRDGRASYVNRFVRTEGFERERAAGRNLWVSTLSDNFVQSVFGMLWNKIKAGSVGKNTANTSVLSHAERLLALWEGGEPHEISLPNLDTLGRYDFNGTLTHPFTAHPKVCPKTGELVFFGYQISAAPYVLYSVADASGRITHTTPVDIPVPVMMHDFAITEHYSLFLDFALEFRMERARRLQSPLAFDKARPARIGVLPRHAPGSEVRWFEFGPGFAFHVLNAHEEREADGTTSVVLYAARYSEIEMASGEAKVDVVADLNCPRLHFWRMNLDTGATSEGPVGDPSNLVDFPRVPDALVGQPFTYGYMPRFAPSRVVMDSILKVNVRTNETVEHRLAPGWFCQEAVFVPKKGAAGEDEGYLLAMASDESSASAEGAALLVLDARDMREVARVAMPQRVPYGFHGAFVPAS